MTDFGPLRTLPQSVPREPQRSEPRLQQIKPGGLLRRPWFIRLLSIGILLAVWQLVAFTNARIPGIQEVVSFFITELTGGVHAGRSLKGNFWGPLLTSLQRYGIGLLIGLPAGFGLGILIGASSLARGLLNDTTLALLALPSVVWAFLSTLWFGLTSQGPIFAVILTVTPFVAVSVSSGVRNIDKGLIEMCDSFRVPLFRRTQHLILGGTLPNAITGIRLAFMAGWNSLLIVEWFGASSGVGARAKFLYDFQEFPGFVSWVLLFILLIMLVDRFLLRPLERRAFRWNERPLLTLEENDTSFQAPEQNTLQHPPEDTPRSQEFSER